MNEDNDKNPETVLLLKNRYGNYRISIPKEDLTIGVLIEELIIPVLMAAGYGQKLIEEYIPSDFPREGLE